jgi:glutamine amidotransferase
LTAIIYFNLGNPKSIKNMLACLGNESIITSNKGEISSAERLILPGVGNFKHGIEQLYQFGLIDVLTREVLEKGKPILGICLGMQLLTKFSEEGNVNGLSFIDAQTRKFKLTDSCLKVPHMGWNTIDLKKDSPITSEVFVNSRYYFVHSFFVDCFNQGDVLCTTQYGYEFVSGFQHKNIFGFQFHPEKSHKYGKQLLANFCMLK